MADLRLLSDGGLARPHRASTPPDPRRTLTEQEQELDGEQLPDWRMLIDRLHASLDTGDFVRAVKLVDAISLPPRRWTTIPTSTWPTGGSTSG